MTQQTIKKIIVLVSLSLASLSSAAFAADAAIVANELNDAYKNTADCADGKPAYYCSGIILHAEYFTHSDPWYLSERRQVGSFSYLRVDIAPRIGHPIWEVNDNTGYILTPPQDLEKTQQYAYEVYCAYPWDGYTNIRTKYGCGDVETSKRSAHNYSSCSQKRIFTLEDFLKKYTTVVKSETGDQYTTLIFKDACSFSATDEFKTSMDIYKYSYRDHPEVGCGGELSWHDENSCYTHNELVISTWPKTAVKADDVPIKAIYVLINGGDSYEESPAINESAVRTAFKIAENYSKATNGNREIPVVTLDMTKLKEGGEDIFAPAVKPSAQK